MRRTKMTTVERGGIGASLTNKMKRRFEDKMKNKQLRNGTDVRLY